MKLYLLCICFVININLSYSQFKQLSLINKTNIIIKESNDIFIGNILNYDMHKNGYIYLTDTNNKVIKISPQGSIVNKYDKNGKGPGEISRVWNIKVTENKILVEDTGNNKIIVLDTSLHYIKEFHKKDIVQITNMQTIKNKLIAYSFNSTIAPIVVYDLDNLENIKFIKYDEEIKTTNRYNYGGGMSILKNKIYFIGNVKYKIYESDLSGKIKKINKTVPSHFVEYQKKINDNNMNTNYSRIISMFNFENYIIVLSLPPDKNGKSVSICDVYSLDGKYLGEASELKGIIQSRQVNNRFIKIIDGRNFYPSNDPKSNISAIIYEVKKNE